MQGEILSNHAAEVALQDAAPEVVFVRCAYFMENWAMSVDTIKEGGFFFTTLTPLDHALPMVRCFQIDHLHLLHGGRVSAYSTYSSTS